MLDYWIIWLIVAIACFVIEIVTLGLTTIWCVVGAVVALIADLCGASAGTQIVLFSVISVVLFVICLIWIKPMLDKRMGGRIPTNGDKVIGKTGVVIKTFSADDYRGVVKVLGQEWTAIADRQFNEGDKVFVKGMDGIKLVVEAKEQ